MAVNQSNTDTVQGLLAEENCEVNGVLDMALIRDNTQMAAILQNNMSQVFRMQLESRLLDLPMFIDTK